MTTEKQPSKDNGKNKSKSPSKIPPQPTVPSAGSEQQSVNPAKTDVNTHQVGVTAQDLQKRPAVSKPIVRPSADENAAGEDGVDRRTFIKWAALGWTAFAAVVAGYGTLLLRYLFPNVLFEPKQSFRAGRPDDYVVGEVSEQFKETQAVWIVRDPEKIYALSTVCTHLGCTPNWQENEQKYKCPCHGSGFYKNGINFEGPAPRPLERFKISQTGDGEIIVDKTKKFQQEKGEWNDPESFILA
ncbi:MAG: ubiquinol-cytochrome c reductase iron-sulfur subunit [Candidatus Omnitrophica bacterium]|nr:ubiquinol-cytochrome c reductase iron-sulfur subunit [Candidatus Omnitrophota bacterium]